jgi:hypothetical protein
MRGDRSECPPASVRVPGLELAARQQEASLWGVRASAGLGSRLGPSYCWSARPARDVRAVGSTTPDVVSQSAEASASRSVVELLTGASFRVICRRLVLRLVVLDRRRRAEVAWKSDSVSG